MRRLGMPSLGALGSTPVTAPPQHSCADSDTSHKALPVFGLCKFKGHCSTLSAASEWLLHTCTATAGACTASCMDCQP